jgi:hypothetical protein
MRAARSGWLTDAAAVELDLRLDPSRVSMALWFQALPVLITIRVRGVIGLGVITFGLRSFDGCLGPVASLAGVW